MKYKKIIINALIFFGLVLITFYLIFKDNNIKSIIITLKDVNLLYILIGIIIMFIFIGTEALNIKNVLTTLNYKLRYIECFKYAIVGFFFSSVTPSASGGQPLQVYYMKKDNIEISHSLLALLVELFSFQTITCLFGLIGLTLNYKFLITNLGNLKYLIFLGLTLNLIVLITLIILLFSKKLALAGLKLITKILKILHFSKIDKFYQKSIQEIEEYHKSSLYLKKHKSVFYKSFFISSIKIFLYHSIPYFVYLAFGLNGYNIIDFVLIESVLYAGVSSLPFPGAIGVSEGSFMAIFRVLYPETILSSALLLSRGISFYLFLIISGILLLGFTFLSKGLLNKKI